MADSGKGMTSGGDCCSVVDPDGKNRHGGSKETYSSGDMGSGTDTPRMKGPGAPAEGQMSGITTDGKGA